MLKIVHLDQIKFNITIRENRFRLKLRSNSKVKIIYRQDHLFYQMQAELLYLN